MKCKARNVLLVKRIMCYTMEELNNKKKKGIIIVILEQ